MAHVHLVIGPVGSGKSTFALQLAGEHGGVRLILDEWMVVLFGDDERPEEGRMQWYMERTDRCLRQIRRLTEDLLAVGKDVVLEVGLIQRAPRRGFYEWLDGNDYAHTVYLVDAPRDIRRERVMRRNEEKGATYSQAVPPAFFELASDLWEPPDHDEIGERDLRIVPQ